MSTSEETRTRRKLKAKKTTSAASKLIIKGCSTINYLVYALNIALVVSKEAGNFKLLFIKN